MAESEEYVRCVLECIEAHGGVGSGESSIDLASARLRSGSSPSEDDQAILISTHLSYFFPTQELNDVAPGLLECIRGCAGHGATSGHEMPQHLTGETTVGELLELYTLSRSPESVDA